MLVLKDIFQVLALVLVGQVLVSQVHILVLVVLSLFLVLGITCFHYSDLFA